MTPLLAALALAPTWRQVYVEEVRSYALLARGDSAAQQTAAAQAELAFNGVERACLVYRGVTVVSTRPAVPLGFAPLSLADLRAVWDAHPETDYGPEGWHRGRVVAVVGEGGAVAVRWILETRTTPVPYLSASAADALAQARAEWLVGGYYPGEDLVIPRGRWPAYALATWPATYAVASSPSSVRAPYDDADDAPGTQVPYQPRGNPLDP